MSIFVTKLDEYRDKVLAEETKPKYLYIGTNQRRQLISKTKKQGLNGQKYEGLEIVFVSRQDFFEVG